jgi:hypothetical protein
MTTMASAVIRPLIKRNIFRSEEDAVRVLLREYMLHQIEELKQRIESFHHKYGMDFQEFVEYVHARSTLLQAAHLSLEQRQALGQAIMQEEDDWLDWKAATDMLENWLGIRQEVTR